VAGSPVGVEEYGGRTSRRGAVLKQLADFVQELKGVIDEGRDEDHIPGVALAVAAGDEIAEYAAGVLNLDTGVEATPDSLFQIGSITKTFTATLVMQLVDEGLVGLDEPVRRQVPEFSVADPEVTERVTVRQLLCHTGGFDGDVFDDFGRGDDAVARYVEALKDREQNSGPGERFSYCNSGFSVLGRLVERVGGLPSWDDALRTRLVGPLGLSHTVSLAEEALMFRTAVGHVDGEGGNTAEQRLAPAWQLPRSTAPVGGTTCASARDLVEWARFHLRGGVAADGTRVLSAASAAAMREPQTVLPAFDDDFPRQSWGLGWQLTEYRGGRVFGHGGNTIGQSAMLEIAPEAGVVYVLLTNGGAPIRMMHAIRTRVFGALAGIEVPPRPEPPSRPVEIVPERFVGRYQNAGAYYIVRPAAGISEPSEASEASDPSESSGTSDPSDTPAVSDGGLEIEVGARGALKEQLREEPRTYRLTGFSPTALITSEPENGEYWRLAFMDFDSDGRATAAFSSLRVIRRVEDSEQEG
jgi:CubicO group peptidase (beta-lactamase class C family)